MGYQTVVYGIIESYPNFSEERLYADWNKAVILNIPEEDEFPFLVKDMFSITERNKVSLDYHFQIIHFGASYKEVESNWDTWLNKFEALLSKLYWARAVVYMEAELVGNYKYEWLANLNHSRNSDGILSQPISSWEFVGEPRKFEL